jgi:hypothetical protein
LCCSIYLTLRSALFTSGVNLSFLPSNTCSTVENFVPAIYLSGLCFASS